MIEIAIDYTLLLHSHGMFWIK